MEKIQEKEETVNTGVVYCITNIANNKQYIGQAKSYRQNHGKIVRHGHIGRFNEHIREALNGLDGCPKFYNAIRKYGVNSFKTEILVICDLEILSQIEIEYILMKDTVKNGYNVISTITFDFNKYSNTSRIERIQNTMIEKWKDPEYIEKTSNANLKAVVKRADSGKTRKKDKDLNLPANIYKTQTGYDIRIMRNGKYKITSVEGKDLSENEKLQLAIDKLSEIKSNMINGIDDSQIKNKDHNGNPLPKGIVTYTARKSMGYKVIVCNNNKRIEKTFTNSNISMDEKLSLANEKLKELLELNNR